MRKIDELRSLFDILEPQLRVLKFSELFLGLFYGNVTLRRFANNRKHVHSQTRRVVGFSRN